MKASEFIPGVDFKEILNPEYTLCYDTNGTYLLGRENTSDHWEFVGIITYITRYSFNVYMVKAGISFKANMKFKDLEIVSNPR